MEEHNRDMFPSAEVLKLYAPIAALIANRTVDEPFARHEEAAVHAKRSYHFLGRTGILFVVISTTFTVAEGFVFFFPPWIGVGIVVLGILGIGIQLHLLFTKRKRQWLMNRFAAERLRSIKFQAYPLSQCMPDAAEFARRVEEFYRVEVARLNMELNAGEAAFALFTPAIATRTVTAPEVGGDKVIGEAARDAYRDLRINYQRRFATGEIEKLRLQKRIEYTIADFLYIAGAAIAVVVLIAKIVTVARLGPAANTLISWLEFLAIFAFIVALSKSILENASLAETSQARYENYIQTLNEWEAELTASGAGFAEMVSRIERVVLEELGQFSQSALKIGYRL